MSVVVQYRVVYNNYLLIDECINQVICITDDLPVIFCIDQRSTHTQYVFPVLNLSTFLYTTRLSYGKINNNT